MVLKDCIAFLRITFPDPLLSLTASTTLREKALALTPDRKILWDTLRLGDIQTNGSNTANATIIQDSDEIPNGRLHGLQEANILEGLGSGEINIVPRWVVP